MASKNSDRNTSYNCMDVIDNLVKSIDIVNTDLITNMTASNVKYEDVCIKPNLTFDFYHTSLKTRWENIINDYISKPDKCTSNFQNIHWSIQRL